MRRDESEVRGHRGVLRVLRVSARVRDFGDLQPLAAFGNNRRK